MLGHEYVFSQSKEKRFLRHFLFWAIWWLYFFFCDYLYQHFPPLTNTISPFFVTFGAYPFLKTFILTIVYAVAGYSFIYFVLSLFMKGKWVKPIGYLLLLFVCLCTVLYFLYWTVFPFVDAVFGTYKAPRFKTLFWPVVYLGLINPVKVLASIAIIKYVKRWWVRQKEAELLERGKIAAELQLLKAQIHPGFLLTSLDNIHDYAVAGSQQASGLLLKLSDMLSYMLYECEQPLVPLHKEILIMEDYMAMEKLRFRENFDMELNVRGEIGEKVIAPFLLLPFIENSFSLSSNESSPWINMDITLDGDLFNMKLANGMDSLVEISTVGLSNVQKRLTLLYPQKHEIKISREEEMFIVHLKIQLQDPVLESDDEVNLLFSQPDRVQPNIYAAP